MKKVKLDLEALEVESFQTTAGAEKTRGTVHGHATLVCTEQFTCTSCEGSNFSCGIGSCGATCGGVCGPGTFEYLCTFPASCNYCEI